MIVCEKKDGLLGAWPRSFVWKRRRYGLVPGIAGLGSFLPGMGWPVFGGWTRLEMLG